MPLPTTGAGVVGDTDPIDVPADVVGGPLLPPGYMPFNYIPGSF